MALLAAGAVAGCRVTPVAPQQPPTVKVAVAVEAEGDRALRLSGTIEAERSTALSFSVPGTIQEVRAADGARVVRGRVLARLDPRTFQDAVGIAELKVEQAEDAARRLEPMHRNGTIPDIKWVEVDTGLRQARLALSMAKKSLEDTVLRAPQDGVVARRLVEPGGTALPGSPAFVLVQSRTMLATAPLPEREVATVRVEIAESVTTASITAIQPVFVGGRIANGHELAVLGVEIAREGVAMARRDAVARVEEKYWRLLQVAEKERTLATYQELLQTLQRQADDAVRGGLATRNDSLEVEVQRKKAEIDRLRLESGLRLAARDLRRQLGLPAGDSIALEDSLDVPVEPVEAEAPDREREQGPDRRPEVRQLERAVKAEALQTALKEGERLPTLSVGATALHHRVSGLEPYDGLLAFATVSIPLSGIWEGAHASAAQREKERIARTRLADARDAIRLEIEKRRDDLWTAWRAVAVAEAAVRQAEVNLLEERDRYQGVLSTVADLPEAQVLLRQAHDLQTESRTEYGLARSSYRRAMGNP